MVDVLFFPFAWISVLSRSLRKKKVNFLYYLLLFPFMWLWLVVLDLGVLSVKLWSRSAVNLDEGVSARHRSVPMQ